MKRAAIAFGAICLGLAASPAFAGSTYVCQGGDGMQISEKDGRFILTARTASTSPAAPGECFRQGGTPLPEGATLRTSFPSDTAQAIEMATAAGNGGNFSFDSFLSRRRGTTIVVGFSSVISVEPAAAKGGGAEPDDADDGDQVGDAGDDMDDAGDDVEQAGMCALGSATVDIPEEHLTKLNVRTKPGGKVVGTVREGKPVEVVGPCGRGAAAGFARNNNGGGADGWCQIDAPVSGCVMAKYLEFDGDGGGADNAAGFARKKRKQN